MNQVVKAASPAEIARVEARNKKKQREQEMAALPAPKFVSTEERQITIDLKFPLEWNGTVYEEVTIRRPNIREWNSYVRAVADAIEEFGEEGEDRVDMPWLSIPAVVFNALDFADATTVSAAQDGFFGRSSLPDLSEETTEKSSESSNGEPTPSE